MKCPVCGGTIKKEMTNLPIEMEAGLLYVKNIPADVCTQCGEVFIPDGVAAELEKIVANAKKQKAEIEVVNYQGAA